MTTSFIVVRGSGVRGLGFVVWEVRDSCSKHRDSSKP